MDDFSIPIESRLPRRKKTSLLGTSVFYLSSLVPGLLILWYIAPIRDFLFEAPVKDAAKAQPERNPFDMRSVREKLEARMEEAVSTSTKPVPTRISSDQPKLATAASAFDSEPKSTEESPAPTIVPESQTRSHEPDDAKGEHAPDFAVELGPTVAAHAPPATAKIALSLATRKQRAPLAIPLRKHVLKVAGLRGTQRKFELEPASGEFDERAPALVIIEGPRTVRMRINIDAKRSAEPSIVIELTTHFADGDEVPFTLEGMKRIRDRILKEGNNAADRAADVRFEISRIADWLSTPGAKPLAAVGEAKARGIQLAAEALRTDAAVKQLEVDLAVASEMLELAEEINSGWQLEVRVAD